MLHFLTLLLLFTSVFRGSLQGKIDFESRFGEESLLGDDEIASAADTGFVNGLRNTEMCFVAGTLVVSKIGAHEQLLPIKQLETAAAREAGGLEVWSRDEFTGEEGWKRPLAYFTTYPSELVHLAYDVDHDGQADETLTGTPQHPFWVNGRSAFVPMGELEAGQMLYLENGGAATITGASRERAPPGETFTTYNFEVEDFHTYFVGESGVWVHNHGAPCEKIFAAFQSILHAYKEAGYINGVQDLRRLRFEVMSEALRATKLSKSDAWARGAAVRAVQKKMHKDFVKGHIELADLPTHTDVKSVLSGKSGGWDSHHAVEVNQVMKKLGLPPTDDVPAYIIPGHPNTMDLGPPYHRGKADNDALATVIRTRTNAISTGIDDYHQRVADELFDIYDEFHESFPDFGFDDLHDVTWAWLKSKNLPDVELPSPKNALLLDRYP